jgi:F0F1-type ATP synthase membrane subunit a
VKGLLIFIGIIVVSAIGCVWLPFMALPGEGLGAGLPVIYVPGEPLESLGHIPGTDVPITNSLVGAVLTTIIVLGLLILMRVGMKEVPGRLQAFFEMIVELWDGLARSSSGARGRQLLPLALSIFFFLLVANLMKIVPGVDTVGELHCAGLERGPEDDPEFVAFNGYPVHASKFLGFNVLKVEKDPDGDAVNTGARISQDEWHACHEELEEAGDPIVVDVVSEDEEAELGESGEASAGEADEVVVEGEEAVASEEHEEDTEVAAAVAAEGEGGEGGAEGEEHAEEGEEHHAENPGIYVVTPFVRGASTDLALTISIAFLAVVTVQFFGIKELGGLEYGAKFLNLPALGRGGMGYMDFAIGLLELFLEIAKIVSFAFRLFGSMFGGQVLMFVIVFLVATVLPIAVVGLEVFFGAIQAFVFAMLFLMFSSSAMTSHHHDEEHHEHDEAHQGATH